VADKSSQLLLEALGRAALDPAGLPLFRHKSAPGLFGSTALARQAAQRCKEQDLLRVVRTDPATPAPREVVAITPKGLDLLLDQSNPRQVLEDLVRAVELRDRQFGELVSAAHEARVAFEGLRNLGVQALQRLTGAAAPTAFQDSILRFLLDWQSAHAAKDCPLPELYRSTSPPSIGTFHDALRRLHQQQQLWLHPWTGPLCELPEPALALLVGHEVAFYASLRA
jgi:hypothetical protein